MSRSRALAVGALVVTMLLWGTGPALTKIVLAELPPLLLALIRFVIASLLLLPLAQSRGGLALLPRPLPLGRLILMGLTGVTLFFAGSNLGLVYTSAADGALIQGAIPVVTTVLAVLVLRERVDRWRVGGIGVAVLGVGLIVLTGSPTATAPNPLLGNLLTFVAVFSWAIYTMLGKLLGRTSELVVTAYSVLFGTVMLIPFAAYELRDLPTLAVSPTSWLVVLFLGAGASGVAFLLWNYALRALDASQAASYINLIPLIGVASAAVLGEPLSLGQLLGGVLILVGIWLSTRGQLNQPGDSLPPRSPRADG